MTMTTDWNAAAHLLCVRFEEPADILASTPALRALRAQCPQRRITLLSSPAGAALGPYLPDVDAVLAHEAPWTPGGARAPAPSHLDWIATLAARRFDGAVIFTRHDRSALPAALLCQLAGIPLRAAYCRENTAQLLTQPIADPGPGALLRHDVQRQLDLVRRLGAEIADERLAFVPTVQDTLAVRARLHAAGIDPAGRWLVLHPGAGVQARCHGQHDWRSLVAALHARIGCPLVLVGDAHDPARSDGIDGIDTAPEARILSLAGQLDVGGLGALLAQASLVIGHRGLGTQLAAAVGTPVVHLQTQGSPHGMPWQVPSRAVPLAPAQVLEAVCNLLKQTEADRTAAGRGRQTKKASPKTGLSA